MEKILEEFCGRGGGDITSNVEIFEEWGGFHPQGWISPPSPYCQIGEGGDITPLVDIYAKWGGFHPRGGYHPLVLIWPQSTGVSLIKKQDGWSSSR